jgi:hypothetical protein
LCRPPAIIPALCKTKRANKFPCNWDETLFYFTVWQHQILFLSVLWLK